MTEKFPHLVKKMDIQIHVPKVYTKTHEIKFSKTKDKKKKVLRAVRMLETLKRLLSKD